MSGINLLTFVASIASLILALVAIWLSIVFFKMSSKATKETTEAAKGISANINRLEDLFNKLYSDTFSMMKDTVTDMRKHIWNKPEKSDDNEISGNIKIEIETQISKVLSEANIKESKQRELSQKLESSLEEILQSSKNRKRSIKTVRVLSTIEKLQPITLSKLAEVLRMKDGDLAIYHIFPLRERGEITWSGKENSLTSDSLIKMNVQANDTD